MWNGKASPSAKECWLDLPLGDVGGAHVGVLCWPGCLP